MGLSFEVYDCKSLQYNIFWTHDNVNLLTVIIPSGFQSWNKKQNIAGKSWNI